MKFSAHFVSAILMFACVSRLTVAADDTAVEKEPATIRLLVPAYFYPAGEGLKSWNQLIDSHAPDQRIEIVAIANINSGNVGTELDSNYSDVIRRAAKKGLKVIGYITSDYANLHHNAPLELAKTNLTNWFKLYPELDGVFVDEQTPDAAAIDSYYVPLRQHINSIKPKAFVVGNPGNNCVEDFIAKRTGGPIMDVVIIHENNETRLPYQTVKPSEWMGAYPSSRFAMLVHTSKTFAPQLQIARNRRMGYVFVTDAVGPPPDSIHPWGKLPTYWSDELKLVSDLNGQTEKKR